MGVVHLAHSGTGKPVALKLLRPQFVGDDESRARLAREVGSLSRIRSRWVAEVIDADPHAPVPYIATRYVDGPSMHDRVTENGPLEGEQLHWFARCLARGLAAVHDAGVLHRDVKPSNVLMDGDDPILIDFGLARLADDPKVTQTGYLLGTPGYLAPEILHGEEAAPASDVHSWAATVAFAALARPPFGRGPSMAVMDRVRRGEHDLTGLDPTLADLVADALHPEPEARPELPEVLAELRAAAGPPPTVRRPRSAPTTRMPQETEPETLPRPDQITPLAWLEDEEQEDDYDAPVEPLPWEPRRIGLAERLRRGMLLLGLGGAATAGFAAYPWLTLAAVLTGVWLLRSGSLAGSALGNRRMLRGRRWYDAPWAVLRSPWDLLRSVPGTMLLTLWSLGMAAAAGLVCFAVAAGEPVTLAASGAAFLLGLCVGPGSHRVRAPLVRTVRPPARHWVVWLVVQVVLVGGAATLAALAAVNGPEWFPLDPRPLAGRLADLDLSDVAPW